MASFEVLHVQNGPPESFDSNEFSFIPERPSNTIQNGPGNIDVTNMQSAFMSATPDLSMEEIHKRLLELLEENEAMKEALKKNNSMMQEQLSTITAWHEQMSLTKAKQQSSLEKAKEKISCLEKQNAELQQKIDELQKCSTKAEEDALSQAKAQETATSNFQEEKNRLLKERNELMLKVRAEKNFRMQLEQNILGISNYLDNLQSNSKLLEAEKRELTTLNNVLQLKLATLDSDFGTSVLTDEETGYEVVSQKEEFLRSTILDLSEKTDKINELEKQLEEQSAEIKVLRAQSEEQSKIIASYEQLKQKWETSSQEIDSTSVVESYRERCSNLQLKLNECEEKITKLNSNEFTVQMQEEIRNLQDILKLEHVAIQEERKKFIEAVSSMSIFEAENKRLTQLLQLQEKEKNGQLEALKEAEKRYVEQVDVLTAQLVDKEETLEELQRNTHELRLKLNALQEETESIPILKAQVDVYKTELEGSASANKAAQEEVERLANELKMLQAAAHNHGEVSIGSTEVKSRYNGKDRHKTAHKKPDNPTASFTCPLCGFKFTDLKAIENHVNRCLDQAEQTN